MPIRLVLRSPFLDSTIIMFNFFLFSAVLANPTPPDPPSTISMLLSHAFILCVLLRLSYYHHNIPHLSNPTFHFFFLS